MSKYIDVEKEAVKIEMAIAEAEYDGKDDAGTTRILRYFKNILLNAPAADVQEVKHGKWCGTVCSACGESTSEYYDFEYCPRCGAKMDEVGAQK